MTSLIFSIVFIFYLIDFCFDFLWVSILLTVDWICPSFSSLKVTVEVMTLTIHKYTILTRISLSLLCVVIKFGLHISGRNITEASVILFSVYSIMWAMVADCLVSGGVHFDHLRQSTRFHCKVSLVSFVIIKCLWKRYLSLYKYSVLHKDLTLFSYCMDLDSSFNNL